MRKRIAVVEGFRTPMGKAGGIFKNISADDLGAFLLKEFLTRLDNKIDQNEIDDVIIGNVAQPANAANIARVIALKAGMKESIPASTVHRNCASGMESISSSISKIRAGEGEIFLAGGVESMSNIPLFFNEKMKNFFEQLMRCKTLTDKLKVFSSFRPSFLSPVIGVKCGLTDPVSGLIMGLTAEVVARDFGITREEQDKFALRSHNLAEKATESGIFAEEIVPIYSSQDGGKMITKDEGIRYGQNMASLSKLSPYFDRNNGTVTVGNSSQLTDGAAFVLLMSEEKAKKMGLTPLGYIVDYAYAGLDPKRMGLGPVYAASKLFDKNKIAFGDIDLIEINEAFAAQVIGNEIAFNSDSFAKEKLGRDKKIGEIDRSKLNVNGGAIALGHPVGMSGTRIIIHMLRELRRRNKNVGLATLCIGGGQGGAFLLEAN